VNVLLKVAGNSESEVATLTSRLDLAHKDAAGAQKEIDGDFAVLHGFGVVAIWSWLESFAKGLVALWLVHHPEFYSQPPFNKLRIPLGKFVQLSATEQAELVTELLEADLGSSLKVGVTRFESMLDSLGLSGSVPRDAQRTIFELQQVRNVLAHKDAKADRAFVEACPWYSCQVGERVVIRTATFDTYGKVIGEYLLAVLIRVGDAYGQDLRTAARANLPPTEGGEFSSASVCDPALPPPA
jgi:hypothetical protein